MWDDFVAGGPEPCASGAADFVWRSVLDPEGPMKLIIAADGDDRPIGFLLYLTHPYSWSTRPVCYLLDFYVEPAWRGRGVGRSLLTALRDHGRAAGWLKVYWMTQADNAAARRLYDGFAKRSPLVRYDMMLNEH